MMIAQQAVEVLVAPAWLAWVCCVLLQTVQRIRRSGPFGRPAWSAVLVSTLVAGLVLAASFLVPFAIDDAGFSRVAGFSSEPWKAVSGAVLFRGLVGNGSEDVPTVLLGMRLFYLACPLLALVLAGTSIARQPGAEVTAGRWSRPDPGMLVVILSLVLMFPIVAVLLSGFSFWFVPVVQLTVLTAVDELERGESSGSTGVLLAGTVILAFARPEMLASAALTAVIVAVMAARARRWGLAAVALTPLVLFFGASSSVAPMIADRVRTGGFLVGRDSAPDASAIGVVLKVATRVAKGLPFLLLGMLAVFNGILVVGMFGLVSRFRSHLRKERAVFAWSAAIALGILITECLATSVHREWYNVPKYWSKFAIPVWFLGVAVPWRDGRLSSRTVRIAAIVTVVTSIAALASLEVFLQPQASRHMSMWYEFPGIAQAACAPDRADRRVRLAGIDERSKQRDSDPKWQEGAWEPEFYFLGKIFESMGCETDLKYPPSTTSAVDLLDGAHGQPGLLCSPDPQGRPPPPNAVVYWDDPDRRDDVERALDNGAGCGWHVVKWLDWAVVLERQAPPPAPGPPGDT